jgi:hypothetical protein
VYALAHQFIVLIYCACFARFSFTQYTAGGLQSSEGYISGLDGEQLVEEGLRSAGRWAEGINLFSTLTSLQQPPNFDKAI